MSTQNEVPVIKKVQALPQGGIFITKIRKTGPDKKVYQLELRQVVRNPVSSAGGLLGLTMAGHDKFANPDKTRVIWQNFSETQYKALNLPFTNEQIEAAGPMGLNLINAVSAYPALNLILNGEVVECQIVEVDSLTARLSWKDSQGVVQHQQPKRAGATGSVLNFNSKPIYRNLELRAKGKGIDMSFEDEIIEHNNQVVGSSQSTPAIDEAEQVANPALVGQE